MAAILPLTRRIRGNWRDNIKGTALEVGVLSAEGTPGLQKHLPKGLTAGALTG